jgi:ribosomal protein L44E
MTQNNHVNRSTTMNLMYEELARAHTDARLTQAREQRRSVYLTRARRLARKAERVHEQTRLVLARTL